MGVNHIILSRRARWCIGVVAERSKAVGDQAVCHEDQLVADVFWVMKGSGH